MREKTKVKPQPGGHTEIGGGEPEADRDFRAEDSGKTGRDFGKRRKMKTVSSKGLLKDLRELIEAARQDVARQVNSALVLLYWRIGKRIRQDILKEKRAEYGEQIVYAVSAQLVKEFGTGFSEKNLRRMVQFAEGFPDEGIVVTLSRQLGWSHFVAIIPLDDDLKRDFYAEMCRIERWSVRTLHKKIRGNCCRDNNRNNRSIPLFV
jgi:hypothetical protein